MDRRTVVRVLERLAFASELLDRPEARAWGGASWSIRNLKGGDLAEMLASGELARVRGVGAASLEIVRQVLAGETPEKLTQLEAELPPGLFEIRRIRGLGPKKVRLLWEELEITTLGELEYACGENRLVDLKGFGAKTQAKVLEGIAQLRQFAGLCRLDQALAAAGPLLDALHAAAGVEAATPVGPLRRGVEVVPGVDLLVIGPEAAALEAVGADTTTFTRDGVEVRLHARPDDGQRGAHEALLTGSDGHVAALQAAAQAAGLKLGALGLWRDDELVPCPDEVALYDALGLLVTAPERREDGVPLTRRGSARPRLLRREDLRGALHNHTTASDGAHSLAEMQAAAAALGLSYLGISDHSESAFYASGLAAEELATQRAEIAALNAAAPRCRLLTGVEGDILRDGALDYPADVLAQLEIVIASVHSRHGQARDEMTARMVTAAANPWTSVIGHPTGRLLLGRPPSDYDVEALLDVCAASGCAIELNASPHRLDLSERWLAAARDRGVLVSIAADAHSTRALAHLDFGVTLARRAGLSPEDVLNCRPADELLAWSAARRAAALASGAGPLPA